MLESNSLNRRQFVQLGTLAAGAALLTERASAEATVAAPALPKLPYAYDALEPHFDARTMEIHHSKHHAAYVAGLNDALSKAPELKGKELSELLTMIPDIADESIRNAIRNHGGGHWNHAFFWETLAPAAQSGAPSEKLSAAIVSAFGSMDAFKKAFGDAATKRFGSGWAWLILQDGKLKITSTPNQDNPFMKGIVPDADLGKPILGLDVWEHAYYLHYQNRRADFITAWWNVVNWTEASKRFEAKS
jgi:Fe-Mn family superoxide dismutase